MPLERRVIRKLFPPINCNWTKLFLHLLLSAHNSYLWTPLSNEETTCLSFCLQNTMSAKTPTRGVSPEGQQGYDVTRMGEEDFERLAVYIVPDVACERGTTDRAEKTLPRSLTLKPSLVLSTPNVKVKSQQQLQQKSVRFVFCIFTKRGRFVRQTEGVWSTGVIPRGTRFGPFEGVPTPNYPNDKNAWRYFWRVSAESFYFRLVLISPLIPVNGGIPICFTNFD